MAERTFTITQSGYAREFTITPGGSVRTFTVNNGIGQKGDDGATGPAGPNSVTSATTSDGTCALTLASLSSTGVISTSGTNAYIRTTGSNAFISTSGASAYIRTSGDNAGISTTGANASIFTTGANAGISTSGGGNISTSGTFRIISGKFVTTISGTQTENRAIAFPDASGTLALTVNLGSLTADTFITNGGGEYGIDAFVLKNGTYTVALSWQGSEDADRAITIPDNDGTIALTSSTTGIPDKLTNGTIAGTLAINSTTITYGTGSASAHRTALGLGTLATQSGTFSGTFSGTSSGTNTGDQTSIVGITGTTAQFNTALTDGDFATLAGSETLTNKTLTSPTIAQINGSTTASGTLTLNSTTNATKGKIIFGSASAYDQVNDRFAIGSPTPAYPFEVVRNTPSTADADLPQILLHNLNTSATSFAVMRVKIGTGYTGGYPDIFLQASGGSGGVVSIRGVSNHAMRFLTNDTSRMTIAASGEVGIGTTSPSTKALLDLTSTAKGFLPPRMTTTQRDAITSVPAGLMVYNTSTNKLNFYNGTAWEAVTSA